MTYFTLRPLCLVGFLIVSASAQIALAQSDGTLVESFIFGVSSAPTDEAATGAGATGANPTPGVCAAEGDTCGKGYGPRTPCCGSLTCVPSHLPPDSAEWKCVNSTQCQDAWGGVCSPPPVNGVPLGNAKLCCSGLYCDARSGYGLCGPKPLPPILPDPKPPSCKFNESICYGRGAHSNEALCCDLSKRCDRGEDGQPQCGSPCPPPNDPELTVSCNVLPSQSLCCPTGTRCEPKGEAFVCRKPPGAEPNPGRTCKVAGSTYCANAKCCPPNSDCFGANPTTGAVLCCTTGMSGWHQGKESICCPQGENAYSTQAGALRCCPAGSTWSDIGNDCKPLGTFECTSPKVSLCWIGTTCCPGANGGPTTCCARGFECSDKTHSCVPNQLCSLTPSDPLCAVLQ